MAKRLSQKEMILSALQAGKVITPLSALEDFGCLALSQRMQEISLAGWPIKREWVTTSTGKRVMSYYL